MCTPNTHYKNECIITVCETLLFEDCINLCCEKWQMYMDLVIPFGHIGRSRLTISGLWTAYPPVTTLLELVSWTYLETSDTLLCNGRRWLSFDWGHLSSVCYTAPSCFIQAKWGINFLSKAVASPKYFNVLYKVNFMLRILEDKLRNELFCNLSHPLPGDIH